MFERWPCLEKWNELLTDPLDHWAFPILGEGFVGLELRVDKQFPFGIRGSVPVISSTAIQLASVVNDLAEDLLELRCVLGLRPY
jgi:hypothetical protein